MKAYNVRMSPSSEYKPDTRIKRLVELSDDLSKRFDVQIEEGEALHERLQSLYAMMDEFNEKYAPRNKENLKSKSAPQN